MKYFNTSIIISLIFIEILELAELLKSDKKIVCYYGSWAVYRRGNGQVKVNDINPNLCTHIIYSFVGLSNNGLVNILDTYNDIVNDGFTDFIKLKKRNPNVKLLIAMGGWNEGSEKYSNIMRSVDKRRRLTNSILQFIQKWGFDGLDLDWEYPAQRGGSSDDKQNIILFFKELRESSPRDFIISAAVGANDYLTDSAYDVPSLNKYLDFINLMTYDYHGSWDSVTGHNAPLHSVEHTVSNWIRNGASSDKLILGMPIYGRTWTLSNSTTYQIGSMANGPGNAGQYTSESGILTYLEICENFHASSDWKKFWDENEQVPYASIKNQWLSYDNPKSVEIKAHYVNTFHLGGAMVWSIDGDDIYGVCGERPYPILNAINKVIKI